MGQAKSEQELVRNYPSEAQVQYHFPPDVLHGGGGKVKTEILDRVYRGLELNYRAQCEMCKFMQFSLFQGQAVKVWYINESAAPPSEEPQREESPWLERQWQRYGNMWLLHLIEQLGVDKPSGKAIVANVAVVVRVAGGPTRVTLMEVDDYLSDRAGRMSQSDLRQLVRDQLFEKARELAFVHYK